MTGESHSGDTHDARGLAMLHYLSISPDTLLTLDFIARNDFMFVLGTAVEAWTGTAVEAWTMHKQLVTAYDHHKKWSWKRVPFSQVSFQKLSKLLKIPCLILQVLQ